jgi:hypothetical protein
MSITYINRKALSLMEGNYYFNFHLSYGQAALIGFYICFFGHSFYKFIKIHQPISEQK